MALLVLLVALPAAACRGEPSSILDAGPRFPDDEGVVTDVNVQRLVLEGARTYTINAEVESFTSRGHEITALVRWKDRYVHVGLKDREVIWVAGIGVVRKADSTVVYTGVFDKIEKGGAVFRDGTVLKLGKGVDAVKAGSEAVAVIDTGTKTVVELRSQS